MIVNEWESRWQLFILSASPPLVRNLGDCNWNAALGCCIFIFILQEAAREIEIANRDIFHYDFYLFKFAFALPPATYVTSSVVVFWFSFFGHRAESWTTFCLRYLVVTAYNLLLKAKPGVTFSAPGHFPDDGDTRGTCTAEENLNFGLTMDTSSMFRMSRSREWLTLCSPLLHLCLVFNGIEETKECHKVFHP